VLKDLTKLTKDALLFCQTKIQYKTETGSQQVRAMMIKQRPQTAAESI
jgi:hypothetical protein